MYNAWSDAVACFQTEADYTFSYMIYMSERENTTIYTNCFYFAKLISLRLISKGQRYGVFYNFGAVICVEICRSVVKYTSSRSLYLHRILGFFSFGK